MSVTRPIFTSGAKPQGLAAQQAAAVATGDLGQVILADLKAFGGWLGQEERAFALDAWGLIKTQFAALSASAAVQIADLAKQALADAKAGTSWEAIVTDILNKGAENGVTWIGKVPDEIILSIATLVQHQMDLIEADATSGASAAVAAEPAESGEE